MICEFIKTRWVSCCCGAVTNSIALSPQAHGELKNLLTALQETIQTSRMPETDKRQALQHAQALAGAATEPQPQRLELVKNTCRWFKGLADELKELPETATKIGEAVARIALLMGS